MSAIRKIKRRHDARTGFQAREPFPLWPTGPHPFQQEGSYEDDDWDDYDEDDTNCTHCGGEGYAEVDDPLWDDCDEFGYGPCGSCNGTGLRSQQWVF